MLLLYVFICTLLDQVSIVFAEHTLKECSNDNAKCTPRHAGTAMLQRNTRLSKQLQGIDQTAILDDVGANVPLRPAPRSSHTAYPKYIDDILQLSMLMYALCLAIFWLWFPLANLLFCSTRPSKPTFAWIARSCIRSFAAQIPIAVAFVFCHCCFWTLLHGVLAVHPGLDYFTHNRGAWRYPNTWQYAAYQTPPVCNAIETCRNSPGSAIRCTVGAGTVASLSGAVAGCLVCLPFGVAGCAECAAAGVVTGAAPGVTNGFQRFCPEDAIRIAVLPQNNVMEKTFGRFTDWLAFKVEYWNEDWLPNFAHQERLLRSLNPSLADYNDPTNASEELNASASVVFNASLNGSGALNASLNGLGASNASSNGSGAINVSLNGSGASSASLNNLGTP